MADRLYLSLWYPNFRLESLPAALVEVLRQFALVGGKRVSAASAYPINFTEPPTYQRIYVDVGLDPATSPPEINLATDASDEAIEAAVAEATEQLHDDMAFEFEMRWNLWSPHISNTTKRSIIEAGEEEPLHTSEEAHLPWQLHPFTVRVIGFGPAFDDATFDQNGHIRVDFGLDTPWVMDEDTLEDQALDQLAQKRIQQNIEMLLAFTLSVEKHCGISSRLLWTESGEPLAEKLIARLQRLN